ncbi:glycoside hydrolase family 3 N-terminal domain-containing protein [Clavibacter sepedonicus]|nr:MULTISPECIES: glycoside hydrolase family 3 N-terminal domain-containing protein [Clavibacter]MBD5382653.1 glycosyl hydrolase [Clavibacter sp.]UUK67049.1 glycoside hydrolase family 3 C-terminal domain-containing protein [Clavibacter sepedonicus]
MSTDPDHRDTRLDTVDRVRDLLARMTLEEKAAQITCPFGTAVDVHTPPEAGWGTATAALLSLGALPRDAARKGDALQRAHVEGTRLGIPVLLAEEALIGLKVRGATTFPDAIAQAATWDAPLIRTVASRIGLQMSRMGIRQALSPLADVARDPRWGRVEETYGEEPYLVGTMASAFVDGLQTADPERPLIATLKHFIGYGASDGGRNTDVAHMGAHELREVYALPFEMAIHLGGARGVMPAYNSIDGVPVTGSRALLRGLLRDELGFDGLITSDLEAVSQLSTKHATAPDAAHAFAQALRAGVNADLDNKVSGGVIVAAVRDGVLTVAELDDAVGGILRAKLEIGLLDQPYIDLDAVPESLDSDEDRALARLVAERSAILLRNEAVDGTPVLPLPSTPQWIAVIGPNAHRPMGQLGNYSYQVLDSMTQRFAEAANPQARISADLDTGADGAELLVESVPVVTFLEGIRARAHEGSSVVYARGCPVSSEDRSGIAEAVETARTADVAVLVVGDQAGIGAYGTVGEGIDSATCELPGIQRELVEAVVATGTPTVVVLSHGRPYVLGWMAETVPAIVSSFFGGEEAGPAVASVLFGDVNPAGRLPIAMLESVGAAPLPYWRTLMPDSYADGSTRAVFPFGHGLSYTAFEYRDLAVESDEVPTDGSVRLSFTVVNVGERSGDEVVQVYGRDMVGRTTRRGRVLVGYERVALEAGAAVRVSIDVPASVFALWDATDGWVVEPGLIRFYVGPSSAVSALQAKVVLTGGEARPGRDRALVSTIRSNPVDPDAATGPARAIDLASVVPVTAESTVREWLDHPVGGPELRAALGGVEEDMLADAFGLSLERMAFYSQGAIPGSLVDDLVERVRVAHVGS